MAELQGELKQMMTEFSAEGEQEKKLNAWLDTLKEDELKEALKSVNPYGIVLPHKENEKRTVSFSYTNYRMEFAKQYCTTGIIGYAFRQLLEYKVPDEIKPVPVDEYVADPKTAEPPSWVKDERLKAKYEENKAAMAEKVAIYKFLKHIFDFDPDKHVRSSLMTNKKDPTRRLPDTPAAKLAVETTNTVTKREKKPYEADVKDMTHKPTSALEASVFGNIPPQDTFHRLDRYMEEHHEEFLQCVNDIHGAKPDIEFAVNIYDVFADKKAADKFKNTYMDQVIAPITNIDANRWALLGPYRQNRERVDFYSKNTEILKQMQDKREQDGKLAMDIVKKRAKVKKAQNIKEAGPDDKEFVQYVKSTQPAAAKLGATYYGEHVKDKDDKDDCPKDHVEVNMFAVGDGGREMKVHKIYNPVEAPSGAPVKDDARDYKEPLAQHATQPAAASTHDDMPALIPPLPKSLAAPATLPTTLRANAIVAEMEYTKHNTTATFGKIDK